MVMGSNACDTKRQTVRAEVLNQGGIPPPGGEWEGSREGMEGPKKM